MALFAKWHIMEYDNCNGWATVLVVGALGVVLVVWLRRRGGGAVAVFITFHDLP